jgi:hypothetical protein
MLNILYRDYKKLADACQARYESFCLGAALRVARTKALEANSEMG